ncbi:hypothetical protein [Pseudomonas leptonychotis]|uniref:hypothetical protein n=1 Tax=Pseudomonas leptonychotis TaxID=2448482 RepID=UPI003868AA7F
MSRFTVWSVCCLATSAGLILGEKQASLLLHIAFYVLAGIPLALHYISDLAFSKKKNHD